MRSTCFCSCRVLTRTHTEKAAAASVIASSAHEPVHESRANQKTIKVTRVSPSRQYRPHPLVCSPPRHCSCFGRGRYPSPASLQTPSASACSCRAHRARSATRVLTGHAGYFNVGGLGRLDIPGQGVSCVLASIARGEPGRTTVRL